jgi:predicted membrane protein
MKKADKSIVIIGYVFAFLGGIFGVLIGANYAFSKYDQETKKKDAK